MCTSYIHTGTHAAYYWLTSSEAYSGTILRLCPEVFLGRYLAITAVDGGVVQPTNQQHAAGWELRRGVAYSPKLTSVGGIPHQLDGPDGPGYDEYYTFETPCDLGERSEGNLFVEPFAPAPGKTAVFVT